MKSSNVPAAVKPSSTPKRLPSALIPIYGTTLADTLGYTLMIPLLPIVVSEYHASDVMVGSLLSIPAFFSAIAAPIWGKLSDGLGRKNVIIASQILSLAGYLMLAFAHSLLWIFLSRIISGCGGGGLGAVQSYIADVTTEDQRESAYALYGAVFGAAFILGPILSGALVHRGLSIPFFVAAGLELFNIVFTALFLPLKKKHSKEITSLRRSLQAANEPRVRILFVRQFLFIFAVVCFLANFALFVHHTLHGDVQSVGWLLALAGAVGGVALLGIVAPLARRIGDRRTAQLGLFFSAVGYLLLAFVNGTTLFCIALLFWAVGSAMVEPTLTALLSERAEAKERGAVMGVSDSINSVALILAPSMGAAIVGANARLLSVLPLAATLLSIFLGWRARFITR